MSEAQYGATADKYARMYGLDPALFRRVVAQESRWNIGATSPKGADGLAQVMPDTARDPGYRVKPLAAGAGPEENLRFGAEYLAAMIRDQGGDVTRGLQAYNWGPGRMQNWDGNPANMPDETRMYTANILSNAAPSQQQGNNMAGLLGSAPQQEQPKQSVLERMTGGFLTPDRTDRAIIAMQGMTMNPNEALMRNAQANISGRADQRATQEQTNKTVALLERMGADPKLIEAARNGYAKEAVAMAFAQPEAQKGIAVDGRIVNPVTGEVIYDGAGSGIDAEGQEKIRKEFTALPGVKSFALVSRSYGKLIASVNDPSPAGDMALIFNYMKILDPGSAVKEGEYASAEDAGSVPDKLRVMYNSVITGTKLSESQRNDFADRSTRLYENSYQQYKSIEDQYAKFASDLGFDPTSMMPDFSYSGDLYETPLSMRPPKLDAQALLSLNIKADEWAGIWSSMTDQQRQEFMEDMK